MKPTEFDGPLNGWTRWTIAALLALLATGVAVSAGTRHPASAVARSADVASPIQDDQRERFER